VELLFDTPNRLSMPDFDRNLLDKSSYTVAQVEIVVIAEIAYLGPTHGEPL
jgi:hypothetical protein